MVRWVSVITGFSPFLPAKILLLLYLLDTPRVSSVQLIMIGVPEFIVCVCVCVCLPQTHGAGGSQGGIGLAPRKHFQPSHTGHSLRQAGLRTHAEVPWQGRLDVALPDPGNTLHTGTTRHKSRAECVRRCNTVLLLWLFRVDLKTFILNIDMPTPVLRGWRYNALPF